jgi:hypothetical protein
LKPVNHAPPSVPIDASSVPISIPSCFSMKSIISVIASSVPRRIGPDKIYKKIYYYTYKKIY